MQTPAHGPLQVTVGFHASRGRPDHVLEPAAGVPHRPEGPAARSL